VKVFSFLLLMMFIAVTLPAQMRRPINISMSTCGIDTAMNCFAANPATLGQLKDPGFAIGSERKFFLAEFNSYYAASALPVNKHGGFALNAGYSGFNLYYETQVGLAYGRQLTEAISVGLRFNYNSIAISTYGKSSILSVEAGLLLRLTDKLIASLHIDSPAAAKFGKDGAEQFSSVYTAAFGYRASQKFYFGVDVIKEAGADVNINAAFQYKPVQQLLVKCIVFNHSIGIGARFILPAIQFEVAASYHQQLGLTPGLLLLFNLKKKAA
jgi:hypothetical protein